MAKRRRQQRAAASFRVRLEPLFSEIAVTLSCKEPSKLSLSRLTAPAPINGGKGKGRQACYLCILMHTLRPQISVELPSRGRCRSNLQCLQLLRPGLWVARASCMAAHQPGVTRAPVSRFSKGPSMQYGPKVELALMSLAQSDVQLAGKNLSKAFTGLQGGCALPCD